MAILTAYDGKPHSKKALEYSIDHAIAYGKPLFIVSVVNPKGSTDSAEEIQSIKGNLEKAKALAVMKGIGVQTFMEIGSPAESILSAAERVKADTIVVGRHNMTTLDRVVIGSVSESIIRNAKCTVIVVQ